MTSQLFDRVRNWQESEKCIGAGLRRVVRDEVPKQDVRRSLGQRQAGMTTPVERLRLNHLKVGTPIFTRGHAHQKTPNGVGGLVMATQVCGLLSLLGGRQ